MLSGSQLKYLTSLQLKKHRQKYGEFIIEGEKMLQEAIGTNQEVRVIIAIRSQVSVWMDRAPGVDIWEAEEKDFKKVSSLSTAPEVLAVVKMPESSPVMEQDSIEWTLVLDGIRDPGNLGTMLRTADWFGIRDVFCSNDCVELYNPKTIQATMGSLFRLNVNYTELSELLEGSRFPAYAATMNGRSLSQRSENEKGYLVIGSESHGISKEILALCSHHVHIPGQGGAESLNAAVACGILLWELCGRNQSS